MSGKPHENKVLEVFESPKEFFSEVVSEAFLRRKLKASEPAQDYLVNLLLLNVNGSPLLTKEPLAEMYLKAVNAERSIRVDLFRRLGDTSLYVSGFFGDSLSRKLVDIDYYADLGGLAYASLADEAPEDGHAPVFREFSKRFLDFVDVLTYISQGAMIQTNRDLLRLYERYVATGSELAKDQLVEKGILTTIDPKKASQ